MLYNYYYTTNDIIYITHVPRGCLVRMLVAAVCG